MSSRRQSGKNAVVCHMHLPFWPAFRVVHCGDIWQLRDGTILLIYRVDDVGSIYYVCDDGVMIDQPYRTIFWSMMVREEAVKRGHTAWPFGQRAGDTQPAATASQALQFLQQVLVGTAPSYFLPDEIRHATAGVA
jgi:hypothetical protein